MEAALERSWLAFTEWRQRPLASRIGVILRCAEQLDAHAEELAELMALEMGKPIAEGRAEAAKCAWVCRYYAENAEEFLAASERESDGQRAYVRYDALGPVLAIMPWNFPLWQFFRFAAPALIAGNTALLKHSPNTPGCALRIEALVREAGAPRYVVQNLFLSNDQAAQALADQRVRAVTLTGSARAGREVAATAGAHLKPIVLELGGSDAFTVFDDADLERAVEAGLLSRCINSGQSCIAAKRFLVQDALFDRFRDSFVEKMAKKVVGDPTVETTEIGPLAREALRDQLAFQVDRAIAAGAKPLIGGSRDDRAGFFYPPTVLVDLPIDSPSAKEEFFGPVAILTRFKSDDEAIAVANSSPYGLGSSVWTADRQRAERYISEIEAGAVFVNGLVKSDPRLPFGGVKDSGYGRELSREGMHLFVNPKTVWIGRTTQR
jgi:succinate-semialdehyde dehydrogenase/glutarate-semialdehyde dehydrogenase